MRGLAARALVLTLVLLTFSVRDARAEEQLSQTGSTVSIQASSAPQVLAGHVYLIFQARCTECHGADLLRPKGKFGYILDLARVAANPKMIVPGMPAQSELYQTVFHDEMPPPKSKRPSLTPEEKGIVRSWIEAGAPAPLPDENSTRTPPLTFGRRILRDIGQFHPPFTHFPIALLLVALPAEFLWKLTRKDSWRAIARFCVMLGAVTAVITATLGWCDAPFSTYAGVSASVLWWHRWFGSATAVWAVLVALLSETSNRRENSQRLCRWFHLTLLIGVILVSIAGYLGASLIYGLNHFSW